MKYLILVALLLSSTIHAQSNFSIDASEVIWQKVFDVKSSTESYRNYLLQNLEFSDIEVFDKKIIATVNNLKIDYKGYGSSEMFTSMYIARNNYNALAIIEFKDDRYRVTVKDIIAVADYSDGLTQQGEKSQLERFATNRRGFRKRFIEKDAPIFNYTFNNLFKSKMQPDDDW